MSNEYGDIKANLTKSEDFFSRLPCRKEMPEEYSFKLVKLFLLDQNSTSLTGTYINSLVIDEISTVNFLWRLQERNHRVSLS